MERALRILLLFVLLLHFPLSTTNLSAQTRTRGIDVSKFQGTINWTKVAKDSTIKFLCKKNASLLRVYYTKPATVNVVWDKIDDVVEIGNVIMNPCAPDYIFAKETITSIPTHVADAYALWDALVSSHSAYLAKSVIGRDESDTYDINCYTLTTCSDNIRSVRRVNKNLKFIWVSCVHGDERDAMITAYLFAKEILENRGNSKHLQMLWDN